MKPNPCAEFKSAFLRSTHVLLVRILAADAGAWTPSRPGIRSRKVDLSLQITETLRGALDPLPGESVRVAITPSDYAGELMMQPLPGAWSCVELTPGAELVVFSRSGDRRVEHLLVEPHCTQIVPAGSVLPGLRIAAKAEADSLSLGSTLALAAPETTRLDPAFAEYLWDKYGEAALSTPSDFDSLASLAERTGLDARTRTALLEGGYSLVKMHGDGRPELAQRLALAMCRVLLMAEAADLHENLIGTTLPNLLGITSGLPRQDPTEVFKDHPAERSAVATFLRQRGAAADAAPLEAWLGVR